jgi:hypothetical protein
VNAELQDRLAIRDLMENRAVRGQDWLSGALPVDVFGENL